VFIEAKDDGGGGDNWTAGNISRAKLQSNHYHQQTNIQFFYSCPTNSVKALKGKSPMYYKQSVFFTCRMSLQSPNKSIKALKAVVPYLSLISEIVHS